MIDMNEQEIILYNEENYIFDIVNHFISMNRNINPDKLILDNEIRCVLNIKDNPTELFTFDKNNKIRIFIPLEVHINKLKCENNFNKILNLNGKEVSLRNTKLDIKMMKRGNKIYANLILYSDDYDLFERVENIILKDQKFIDDDQIFLNYINEGSFIFVDNFSDILFFSKINTYKSETVNSGIIVKSKLDTYSIDKNIYL